MSLMIASSPGFNQVSEIATISMLLSKTKSTKAVVLFLTDWRLSAQKFAFLQRDHCKLANIILLLLKAKLNFDLYGDGFYICLKNYQHYFFFGLNLCCFVVAAVAVCCCCLKCYNSI